MKYHSEVESLTRVLANSHSEFSPYTERGWHKKRFKVFPNMMMNRDGCLKWCDLNLYRTE